VNTHRSNRGEPAGPAAAGGRPLVGWREWLALPELGVPRIKCKVDTGARSSSLHAFNIQVEEVGGETWVRFGIHPEQRREQPEIVARARLLEYRHVRSSSGHLDLRPVILTSATVGTTTWPIELTLTNRDAMGFRMLLGRMALKKRFWIDPNRSFLHGAPLAGPSE
jgi:hypothetical protein